MYVGPDPGSGRPVQRSVTVRGELEQAEQRRAELAAQAARLRALRQPPLRTVGQLLRVWLDAEHDWKPSTWQGYRHSVRRLIADPVAGRPPETLTPPVLRAGSAGLGARRGAAQHRRVAGPDAAGGVGLGV